MRKRNKKKRKSTSESENRNLLRKTSRRVRADYSSESDSDIPLCERVNSSQNCKKFKSIQTSLESSDYDDDVLERDCDIRKEVVPSSDTNSNLSDITLFRPKRKK